MFFPSNSPNKPQGNRETRFETTALILYYTDTEYISVRQHLHCNLTLTLVSAEQTQILF
jgi:hypothetical protein